MPSTWRGPTGAGPIRGQTDARVEQTPAGALLPSAGDPSRPPRGPSAPMGTRAMAGATRARASGVSRPNELRGAVVPNTIRGGQKARSSWAPNTLRGRQDTWSSWVPNRPGRWSPGAGAPTPRTLRWRPRPSGGRDLLRRLALWEAAVGVVPFLNREFRWEEVGLAMILGGVGGALVVGPSGRGGAGLETPDDEGDGRAGGSGRTRAAPLRATRGWGVPILGAVLLTIGAVLLLDAVLGA